MGMRRVSSGNFAVCVCVLLGFTVFMLCILHSPPQVRSHLLALPSIKRVDLHNHIRVLGLPCPPPSWLLVMKRASRLGGGA